MVPGWTSSERGRGGGGEGRRGAWWTLQNEECGWLYSFFHLFSFLFLARSALCFWSVFLFLKPFFFFYLPRTRMLVLNTSTLALATFLFSLPLLLLAFAPRDAKTAGVFVPVIVRTSERDGKTRGGKGGMGVGVMCEERGGDGDAMFCAVPVSVYVSVVYLSVGRSIGRCRLGRCRCVRRFQLPSLSSRAVPHLRCLVSCRIPSAVCSVYVCTYVRCFSPSVVHDRPVRGRRSATMMR